MNSSGRNVTSEKSARGGTPTVALPVFLATGISPDEAKKEREGNLPKNSELLLRTQTNMHR